MPSSPAVEAVRFTSLGSGSKGNASLIEAADTLLLIDCGFSLRELQKRLTCVERDISDISAIIVTHEHSDHIKGVGAVSRKCNLPVYLTAGTLRAGCKTLAELPLQHLFNSHSNFEIGDILIKPVTVPHDASEPSQFVFEYRGINIGLLTDTGSLTSHIIEMLDGCDALMLEFNHCLQMLEDSAYPAHLQQRISGRLGHLSNEQSVQLLKKLDTSRLQYLVAMHLSENNNCPDMVYQLATGSVSLNHERVIVASQQKTLPWMSVTLA